MSEAQSTTKNASELATRSAQLNQFIETVLDPLHDRMARKLGQTMESVQQAGAARAPPPAAASAGRSGLDDGGCKFITREIPVASIEQPPAELLHGMPDGKSGASSTSASDCASPKVVAGRAHGPTRDPCRTPKPKQARARPCSSSTIPAMAVGHV